jgi:NADH-quinone oxidoreductase subunit B
VALDRFLGENSVIFTKSEQLFDHARANSLWYLAYGIACCAIEGLMSAGGPKYDYDRFGIFHRGSPRQADVMIVAGTVNKKMAHALRKLYDQMPEPKWVIAMGACACTGGPFREYPNVVLGVDKVVPVDVYVPGCPPRPESMQYGFMQLQEKIRNRAKERVRESRDRSA